MIARRSGKKRKIARRQKNVIEDIIIYFVRRVSVPVSRYFFAPDPKSLLFSSQLYNLGEDLAKAHKATKIKTVVGNPGTKIPIAPKVTQSRPRPIQHIRFILRIVIEKSLHYKVLYRTHPHNIYCIIYKMMNWQSINGQALKYLQDYLQLDTSNPPGNEYLASDYFESILKKEGIETQTFTTAPGRKILYAKITGTEKNNGLMLSGHSDVVPVERDKWTVEPFGGEIIENRIYGRGAIDMKSCTVMQFIAFLLINKQEKAINRDLIFCVTPDEEIGSKFGMAWLVENHPELLEIEYALNEGGYGFRDIEINKAPIFGIGIAEKKLCWIKLTAIGSPGHGSQPNPSNATVQLNIALEKIISWQQSNYQETFQNDYIQSDDITDKELIAMNQITMNITRMQAGYKHNVIPAKAEAVLDCRLPHSVSYQELISKLNDIIDNNEILIDIISADEEALTATCDWETELIQIMKSQINNHYNGATVFPLTSAYGTDNRFLRSRGINAYGFIPGLFSSEERSGFHNHDEYITTENFLMGCKMMYGIIAELCLSD